MTCKSLFILIVLCGLTITCLAQESPDALDKITNFPEKFIGQINKKAASLESCPDRQTENESAIVMGLSKSSAGTEDKGVEVQSGL